VGGDYAEGEVVSAPSVSLSFSLGFFSFLGWLFWAGFWGVCGRSFVLRCGWLLWGAPLRWQLRTFPNPLPHSFLGLPCPPLAIDTLSPFLPRQCCVSLILDTPGRPC
jgi:hypothetical protein